MTKSVIQMLLELRLAWCPDCSPGEPVPVADLPLSAEPSPDVPIPFCTAKVLLYGSRRA